MEHQPEVVIRPYNPSTDAESIYEHLQKCFRLDSPMFSGLAMSEEDSAPFFQNLIDGAGKADVSYVACDPSGHESVIAGCVLASIEDRDDPNWKKPLLPQVTTQKQKAISRFCDEMFTAPMNELSMAKVLKLDIFSVGPAYRRQQLCKRMVQLCIDDALNRKSCDVAVVLATSHKSQALMAELKFLTLKCLYFDDYNKTLKEEECRLVMKDSKNLSAKVMAKILTARCQELEF